MKSVKKKVSRQICIESNCFKELHSLKCLIGGTENMKVSQQLFIIKDLISSVKNQQESQFHLVRAEDNKILLRVTLKSIFKYLHRTDRKKGVLITATLWDDVNMNPTGWHMTEKFDGMRLYWNGSQFFTRQGRKVKVPESITKQLPSVPLDGELW
jgi:ATP-dependent DNA ligase